MNAPKLEIVIADLPTMEAAVTGDEELGRAIGCEVAEGWAVFTESVPRTRDALTASPDGARWGTRLFLLAEPRMLVGWGGFKGAPREGEVELGYSVAPGYRGRGIATEAVRLMVEDAFAEEGVDAVLAHTLGEPNESTRVLEKSGFARVAELNDPDHGSIWRWRRER